MVMPNKMPCPCSPDGASGGVSPDALPDEAEVRRIIEESEEALCERPAGISDSFAQYLYELRRYPVLSPENEYLLAVEAQRGSREAQEALVRHNLRFVIAEARRHAFHGVPLEDLVQEGNIGLMRAVVRYRPEFGVKLVSYAVYWIRQTIRGSLADQQRAVRLPVNRATQLARLRRTVSAFVEKHGRRPNLIELSTEACVPVHMAEALLQVAQGDVSLDTPRSHEPEGVVLAEHIGDENRLGREIERRCRSRQIERALTQLRERDAIVLRLLFGIDGGREHTLGEIGQLLGVTRERIRQIRERSFRELRRNHGNALSDYLGEHYRDAGEDG